MALPVNTYTTYSAVGIREDLTDKIYDIDFMETPFMNMIGTSKASSTLHEWQTDSLAAVNPNNAQIQGDNAVADASAPTVRLNNQLQISRKVAQVSGTLRSVNTAGRGDELDYQLLKRRKELKRDMESILLNNVAKVAGSTVLASKLAGVESWIATNANRGVGGASPTGDGTDIAVDGTLRTFTEDMLKDVVQQVWAAGGNANTLLVGGKNKQVASTFAGNSTRFDKGEDKRVTAAVDVYESDFGDIKIVPSLFQRQRSALFIQPDMWAMSSLRGIGAEQLAKTGDSDEKMIITEYTLEARNEKANGVIADLNF